MDAMTREILDSVTSIYGRLRLLERQVGHLEEMAFTPAENVRFHMEAANALTGDAAFTQDTIDEAVARVEEAEVDEDEVGHIVEPVDRVQQELDEFAEEYDPMGMMDEDAETDIDEGCCQPWWEPCCTNQEAEGGMG